MTINRALGAVAASKVTSLLVSGILILSDDQMIHLYPTDIIHCKENTKHKIYCESFPSIIVFVIILLNSAYAWNRKRILYKQIVPAPSLAVNVKVTTRRGTEEQAAADTPQRMEIRRSSEDPFKFRKVFMIPDPEAEADTEAAHLQCWPLQSDLSQKLKRVSLIKLGFIEIFKKVSYFADIKIQHGCPSCDNGTPSCLHSQDSLLFLWMSLLASFQCSVSH